MWQYNDLYHHGIKGQRWGVRRFENEDGTLTSAGKKRYSNKEIKEARDKISSALDKDLSARSRYRNNPTDSNYNKWVNSTNKYKEVQKQYKAIADQKLTSEKVTKAVQVGAVIGSVALIAIGTKIARTYKLGA